MPISELDAPTRRTPPKDFALLIGKRLDEKESGAPVDEDEPLAEGSESESMQRSAVSAMMSALKDNDVDSFKEALVDFLEIREGGC